MLPNKDIDIVQFLKDYCGLPLDYNFLATPPDSYKRGGVPIYDDDSVLVTLLRHKVFLDDGRIFEVRYRVVHVLRLVVFEHNIVKSEDRLVMI